VNVALHAVVCLLVHREVLHIFCAEKRRSRGSRHDDPVVKDGRVWALLASLLFAVHPVHCEVVSGLVGRADLLCSVFVLLAVSRYRSWAESPNNAAGCSRSSVAAMATVFVFAAIAMLSKEYGITALVSVHHC
jgi:hypothetical protein